MPTIRVSSKPARQSNRLEDIEPTNEAHCTYAHKMCSLFQEHLQLLPTVQV